MDIEDLIRKRVQAILELNKADLIEEVLPALRKVADMDDLAKQGKAIVEASKLASHEAAMRTVSAQVLGMPQSDVTCAHLLQLQVAAQHAVEGRERWLTSACTCSKLCPARLRRTTTLVKRKLFCSLWRS